MRILQGKAAREVLIGLTKSRRRQAATLDEMVKRIVRDVRRGGDAALRRHAERFDGLRPRQTLKVSGRELEQAWEKSGRDFQAAIRFAARNIRRFATWQKPNEWRRDIVPGATVGQIFRPLAAVGCYVPSGGHPLPSTLLMTAIPAQVAGVPRIVVVSPRPTRETMAAAAMLGIDEFYRVGGVQAIAALAYGTATIGRVDKIVGPGNTYVTAAKRLVGMDCPVDMPAGPTEALIYSNDRTHAAWIAADLVAQAEHDIATLPVFVTERRSLVEAVERELGMQSRNNSVARRSLRRNGYIFLASSRAAAFALINAIAPEHLTVDNDRDVERVRNAGSIFVGRYSSQAIGDYCSGPNHVLPTNQSGRWRGGLSVLDFIKIITVQRLAPRGCKRLAPCAMTLAEVEGLTAHQRAVEIREQRTRARA